MHCRGTASATRQHLVQVVAGCVPSLLQLITRGHMRLTVEATGALAAIVVSAAGQEALLQSKEALLFVELLDWLDSRLERNVLTIITNAAVHPVLRRNLVVCCGALVLVPLRLDKVHLGLRFELCALAHTAPCQNTQAKRDPCSISSFVPHHSSAAAHVHAARGGHR